MACCPVLTCDKPGREVTPLRRFGGFLLVLAALLSALDGYVAYAAYGLGRSGYDRHSPAQAPHLTLAAVTIGDDDLDRHEAGFPPEAPVTVSGSGLSSAPGELCTSEVRALGERDSKQPHCSQPQTGPPAAHTTT